MIKIIISVRDTVAEIFNDPRVEINIPSAIRSFNLSIEKAQCKDDYALYQVGTFDTDTGDIASHEPIKIYSGLEHKQNSENIEE